MSLWFQSITLQAQYVGSCSWLYRETMFCSRKLVLYNSFVFPIFWVGSIEIMKQEFFQCDSCTCRTCRILFIIDTDSDYGVVFFSWKFAPSNDFIAFLSSVIVSVKMNLSLYFQIDTFTVWHIGYHSSL